MEDLRDMLVTYWKFYGNTMRTYCEQQQQNSSCLGKTLNPFDACWLISLNAKKLYIFLG